MKKNNQIITIVALVIAVVALGIGFAAFSSTLTINSSASVNPSGDSFNVVFSSTNNEVTTGVGIVEPSFVKDSTATTHATAENGTLTETTVSGLHANFTEPGQHVKYTFYVHNIGEYVAYLNSITKGNVGGTNLFKVCTPGKDADANLVASACEGISLSITDMTKLNFSTNPTGNISLGANNNLDLSAVNEVQIDISYAVSAARADGPFTVEFGDITFLYESVDKVS